MSRLERLYAPPEIGPPGKRLAQDRRRDLRLAGLFAILMAALALGAVALLRPGLLGGAYRLQAYFIDATGLAPGIPVLQDGYAIGLVDGVEPVFPGSGESAHCPPAPDGPRSTLLPCFRARLRIARNWPIPSDSQAQLASAGLLQGTAIKIAPGQAAERLRDGARLASNGRERDLLAQLASLTDRLQVLIDDTIAPALASIQQQIATIEGLIGTSDDQAENRERLAGVFASLEQLAGRIESVVDAAQLGRILAAVEQSSENLRAASAGITQGTAEVQGTVRRYGELADELKRLVATGRPDLERSLEDTRFLAQELAAALVPILANIEAATRDLAGLSRDLRANPAVILRGRQREGHTPWPD